MDHAGAATDKNKSDLTLKITEQEVTLPRFYKNRKLLYPVSTRTGSYFTPFLQEQEVTLTLLRQEQEVTLPCE